MLFVVMAKGEEEKNIWLGHPLLKWKKFKAAASILYVPLKQRVRGQVGERVLFFLKDNIFPRISVEKNKIFQ